MNGLATAAKDPGRGGGSADEEKASLLLDEKTLSDIESDAGRAEIESRFSARTRARCWLEAAGTCASGLKSPSWWRAALIRTAVFLVPSFLNNARMSLSAAARDRRRLVGPEGGVGGGGSGSSDRRLGPTSYLDGMRGVAAFSVFFCHYFYTCFRIAEGYGFGEDNFHFLKLPFVRLWYQGPPMVCVFFVISGYALSLKPLRLARAHTKAQSRSSPSSNNNDAAAFSATMSSFVFRRFFRLFLPTAASTLLIVLLLRVGAYEWTRDFARDAEYMRNVQETHPERLGSLGAQLADWGRAMFEFVHIWDWRQFGGSTAYDVHLWTIPVEFRCSMMLFLTLIGVARLRTAVRFVAFGVVMLFSYRSDRWEMLLFYSGAILAELDLIRSAHTDPATCATAEQQLLPTATDAAAHQRSASSSSTLSFLFDHPAGGSEPRSQQCDNPRCRRLTARTLLWGLASILALYLMCQPDVGAESTPGWVFLSSLVPEWWTDKYRYWQTMGSILFVASVARLPRWQRLFNSRPVQYLGRISYAVYLMHGPVMHTVGYAIERRAWAITGIESDASYVSGFVLASLFVVPAVIWAADVFWRAVDAPVVSFAKWLEVKCSSTSD